MFSRIVQTVKNKLVVISLRLSGSTRREMTIIPQLKRCSQMSAEQPPSVNWFPVHQVGARGAGGVRRTDDEPYGRTLLMSGKKMLISVSHCSCMKVGIINNSDGRCPVLFFTTEEEFSKCRLLC